MTLDAAISKNPYDARRGNVAAYARYIRYNVDGMYNKTNDEVKRILKDKKYVPESEANNEIK